MKIALIQQSNTADRATNVAKLENNIRSCAAQGAELIVLQELHNGLYFCQTEDTTVFEQAEPIPGPSTDSFGKLAKELGVVIVLSLFEKRAAGLYHNTAVVLEKDGTIAGSATCLADCFRRAVSFGVPLEKALKAATINPAKAVGLYDEVGSLEKGKRADVLILGKDLSLEHVFIGGKELK